jgi:hypothetical protein
MCNAASGAWENYSVAVEHMHIENLFLNNLVKKGQFSLNLCWLDENSLHLDIG